MLTCAVHAKAYTNICSVCSCPLFFIKHLIKMEHFRAFFTFRTSPFLLFLRISFNYLCINTSPHIVSQNRLVKMEKKKKTANRVWCKQIDEVKKKNDYKFVNKLQIFYLNAQCTLLLLVRLNVCIPHQISRILLPNWIINHCANWSKCGWFFFFFFKSHISHIVAWLK